MRQIILDTETTGLQPEAGHKIIEIGCVELINRKLTGKNFHCYINPERMIEAGAAAVHGLTEEFLRDKPVFATIAEEFMNFVRDAELIIHNAPFDVGFINHELQLTKKSWKPLAHYCRIIDTLPLARQLHVGQRNSLDALCKRYGIDASHREFHGALLDAHLLAQVYLAMTGGQRTLFDDFSPVETVTVQTAAVTVDAQHVPQALTVIKATEEECEEHKKYLEKMKSKGKCVWMEEI